MKIARFVVLGVLVLAISSPVQADRRPWLEMTRAQTSAYPEMYSVNVRAVQFLLRARGSKITADGLFGSQTENALKNLQRKHGIVASGKINDATWELLAVTLRPGARGDAVRAMQVLLDGFSSKSVKIDGVYGAQTRSELLKVQKSMNLKADGIVGLQTWSNLSPGGWEGC